MTDRQTGAFLTLVDGALVPGCRRCKARLRGDRSCPRCGPRVMAGGPVPISVVDSEEPCDTCGLHVCGCGDPRLSKHVAESAADPVFGAIQDLLPQGYGLLECDVYPGGCFALRRDPDTGSEVHISRYDAVEAERNGDLLQLALRSLRDLLTDSPSATPTMPLAPKPTAEPEGTERDGWVEGRPSGPTMGYHIDGTKVAVWTHGVGWFSRDLATANGAGIHRTLLAAQLAAEKLAAASREGWRGHVGGFCDNAGNVVYENSDGTWTGKRRIALSQVEVTRTSAIAAMISVEEALRG